MAEGAVRAEGVSVAEGAAVAERVRALAAPLVEAESARLYDVEHNGGVLRVLVDADGGIGLDAITRLARALSREFDVHDPIPGRYTLEVSSPGLERRLRTPEHFRGAIGSPVKLKTAPGFDGPRRVAGVLAGADDAGVEVREDGPGGEPGAGASVRVGYGQIASARTVFEWGPAPKPGRGAGPGPRRSSSKRGPGPRRSSTRQNSSHREAAP